MSHEAVDDSKNGRQESSTNNWCKSFFHPLEHVRLGRKRLHEASVDLLLDAEDLLTARRLALQKKVSKLDFAMRSPHVANLPSPSSLLLHRSNSTPNVRKKVWMQGVRGQFAVPGLKHERSGPHTRNSSTRDPHENSPRADMAEDTKVTALPSPRLFEDTASPTTRRANSSSRSPRSCHIRRGATPRRAHTSCEPPWSEHRARPARRLSPCATACSTARIWEGSHWHHVPGNSANVPLCTTTCL